MADTVKRTPVAWAQLQGETIVETRWGNSELPRMGPYDVQTLITASRREFVVTQCMGEVQLSEIERCKSTAT